MVLGLEERARDLGAMRTLAAAAAPSSGSSSFARWVVTVLGIATRVACRARPFLGRLQGESGRLGCSWTCCCSCRILPLVRDRVPAPRARSSPVAMAEAETRGRRTPALRAAWADPVVRAAHLYELGAVDRGARARCSRSRSDVAEGAGTAAAPDLRGPRRRRAEVEDSAEVLDAAARFLEARPRSIAEVRRRLTTMGYRPRPGRRRRDRLTELRYLDDEAFTRAWVESRDRAPATGRACAAP